MFKLPSLLFCLCTLSVALAMCRPASSPTEEPDEQSRSRASGSACVHLTDNEINSLRVTLTVGLGWIKANATSAKSSITADLDSLPAGSGFYSGQGGKSYQEMLATGVSLLRCSVSYTLDVMKQMASLNPILDMSVSTHFHNVYDLLDPAKDNNLASSLEKLVKGESLNECVIPNQERVCSNMSLATLGVSNFTALLAQDYIRLSSDLLGALD